MEFGPKTLSFTFDDIAFPHIVRSLFQEPGYDDGFGEIKVNFIPKRREYQGIKHAILV